MTTIEAIGPIDRFKKQFGKTGLIELQSGLVVPGTTIFSGQWAGQHVNASNPRTSMAQQAYDMGFDGVAPCTWGSQFNVYKAANSLTAAQEMLGDYTLGGQLMLPTHIETHIAGQGVLTPKQIIELNPDLYEPLMQESPALAEAFKNKAYDQVNDLALDHLIMSVRAAKNAGLDTVIGFLGSNIWHLIYRFPNGGPAIDAGYKHAAKYIQPLLKECADQEVAFALEVHPTEIIYDYYTLLRFVEELEAVDRHTAEWFKINFDPSHFVKQGIDPVTVLEMLPDKLLRRVHIKGASYYIGKEAPHRNGNLSSTLNSHFDYGDRRRASDFEIVGSEVGNTGADWAKLFQTIRRVPTLATVPRELEFETTDVDWVSGAMRGRAFINYYRQPINQSGAFDQWAE